VAVAAVVIVAVYCVLLVRLAEGVKVAVFVAELRVTVPATAFPPCVNVKVLDEMLEAVIASLKVAVTVELMATPVAPFAGATEVTVGAVGGADVLPQPARKSAVEANKQPNAYRMRTPFQIERR
jgi:hypothetical protein